MAPILSRARFPSAAVHEFARGLKSYVGVGTAALADSARRFLRSAETGIGALDQISRLVDIRHTARGFVTLGGNTVGEFRRFVRAADLDGLARSSRVDVPVTSAQRSAFREAMSGTPEMALKDVQDTRVRAAANHADLDVTSPRELSGTARTKLSKITSNLTKALGKGAVVALVIGVTAITVDWAITATERRKGCYMMTTIDGKSTSCKVAAYTCSGIKEGDLCSHEPNYYNATLVLMHISQLSNDDPAKIKLAEACSVTPQTMKEKLSWILDNRYNEAVNTIADMGDKRPRVVGICEITDPQIEDGIVPVCRICTPSDDPSKTTYIDSRQYGDNISFHCSTNPTILETVADAAVSTGVNIWQGVTSGIVNVLKKVGIGLAIVLAVAVVIAIVVVVFRNMRGRRDESEPSSPTATPVNVYTQPLTASG